MPDSVSNLIGQIVAAPAWSACVQNTGRFPNLTVRLDQCDPLEVTDWVRYNEGEAIYLVLPFDQFNAKALLGVYARESLTDPTIPLPELVQALERRWHEVCTSVIIALRENPSTTLCVLIPELGSGLVPLQGYMRVYFNLLTAWFSQLTTKMVEVTYHLTPAHYTQLSRLPV